MKRKDRAKVSFHGERCAPQQEFIHIDELKASLHDYRYDHDCRSWKGPVTGSKDVLQVTKKMKKLSRQLQSQQTSSVTHNRKGAASLFEPSAQEGDGEEEEEEGDDYSLYSVTGDIENDPAIIENPFISAELCIAWQQPQSNYKGCTFDWDKSAGQNAVVPRFMMQEHELTKMKAELQQKDTELKMLRGLLFKARKENHQLHQDLKQRGGRKYDELAAENGELKETVARLNRQLTRLWAQSQLDNNNGRHRIEQQLKLDAKHASKFPTTSKNCSKDTERPMTVSAAGKERHPRFARSEAHGIQSAGHKRKGHRERAMVDDGHQGAEHGERAIQGDWHQDRGHEERGTQGDGHQGTEHGERAIQGDWHQDRGHEERGTQDDGHQSSGHEERDMKGDGHQAIGHGEKGTQSDGHQGIRSMERGAPMGMDISVEHMKK